ncbi:MAG: HEAT repeat domain-containing protein [Kiritimatiellae bacterium]|nr:HEAT repeat domain-containing protein [Kiritimatiellia bacterium]
MQLGHMFLIGVLVMISALASAADVKRVGVFEDARSYITPGMLKTLAEAQYETEIITRKDLQQGDKLNRLDVLFLPGGWNALKFDGFNGRRNMIDFLAQGKGILAGAFRSGYTRTGNRPLFPQIGAVYNRVQGSGVYPRGSGPLIAGIAAPFFLSSWDHLLVQTGPLGEVFLTDSSGLPVGVSGEIYGGRYIALGSFIGMDAKTEAMQGSERILFLNCIGWLAAAPKMTAAEMVETRRAAELEFLRREKLSDYTLNERGPDTRAGIIPELKNRWEAQLQSRQYRLAYALPYCTGADRAQAADMLKTLDLALDKLGRKYQELLAEKINAINAMRREELVADNPFFNKEGVLKMIAAVPGKSAQARKDVEKNIADMESNVWMDNAPQAVADFLYGDAIKSRLFDDAERQALTTRADALLAAIEPQAAAVTAAQYAAAHARDEANVPALIQECASTDVKARREAALELGRLGDRRAIATLVKLLDDPDEKVRTNAILALGWMRSKEAVPALVKAAQGPDKWARRRAVQALGQIGDPAAAGVLLENINNDDYFTRENAVLALGWLKAADAVSPLIKIITDSDCQDPVQRGLMIAAIRALGHIGDPRALPQLEHWVKTADDFPAPRRGGGRIKNIYATAQSLGLQGHAELAMAEIKAGGRGERGVTQADFLARHDTFYGLTRHFNFFAGRPFPVMNGNFPDDPTAAFAYLRDVGATGIHNAWGRQDDDPEQYLKILKRAGDYGLKWIEVMPMDGNQFGSKNPYKQYRQDRTVDKAGAEAVLFKVADIPSFQGFWTEEDYPNIEMNNVDFINYLTRKYGADFRKKLDVPADAKELLPPRGKRDEENFVNKRVFAEFLELAGDMLLEHWREAQEWLHGVRKGCAFTFSATVFSTYPGVAGKAGGIIDGHGPEDYQSFGANNAFRMELAKDGEARPVMCEFYNWYCPSPEHAVRGFAQHLMHGECFFNFSLEHIFPQASDAGQWTWDARRWQKAAEIFQKARLLKDYLAIPESAANAALIVSERTHLLLYAKGYGERVSQPRRYLQNQSGLWSALQQSQIPSDAIWAETMTAAKLRRYKILLLSDAKSLTPDETGLIRQWVKDGGILIAGGTTSLFDQSGVQQKNYGLSDVFGLDYAGHANEANPEKNDTFCWDAGRPTFLAGADDLLPEKNRFYVHRDIKPVKSIGVYAVTDEFALDGISKGGACEYDLPLGYDRIKPTTARPLANFAKGDPALTVNTFGAGLCYFWTPIYPGLCHVASGWEMHANFKDFWPGVRELLSAMIKGGLKIQGAQLPVEAAGCPKDLEITVRQQPELNRWMIHLLNMDPNLQLVRGVALTISHPPTQDVKISYPDNGRQIAFQRAGDKLVFTARDFEAHDMILVEFGKRK